MARKIVWAYAAKKDLDAGAAYIHRDSPAYAASFVNPAFQSGRSLSESILFVLPLSPNAVRIMPQSFFSALNVSAGWRS